jgi:2'-5' RNA ligase
MGTIRTFIALNIPIGEELKVVWSKLQQSLRNESIKWVDPYILHLTLFFLGDTPIEIVPSIKESLYQNLNNVKIFGLSLKGIGIFGSKHNPKVIWVGVESSQVLAQTYQRVVDAVLPYGFKADERGFNPHITLGRVKHITNPSPLIKLTDEHNLTKFQETGIDSVIFYKSELNPKGPIYTPIYQVKFI